MFRTNFLNIRPIIVILSDTHTHSKRAADDLKIVCYYSNWAVYRPGLAKFTPQNINPYLCVSVNDIFGLNLERCFPIDFD
jgi:GH18 family chitinase